MTGTEEGSSKLHYEPVEWEDSLAADRGRLDSALLKNMAGSPGDIKISHIP